jgi:sulfur relay (sulfurtransferase) DsrC/TusE family protein
MTTITIKNGKKPSRTIFENWEDFLIEWAMMQEKFELTPEHIKI